MTLLSCRNGHNQEMITVFMKRCYWLREMFSMCGVCLRLKFNYVWWWHDISDRVIKTLTSNGHNWKHFTNSASALINYFLIVCGPFGTTTFWDGHNWKHFTNSASALINYFLIVFGPFGTTTFWNGHNWKHFTNSATALINYFVNVCGRFGTTTFWNGHNWKHFTNFTTTTF